MVLLNRMFKRFLKIPIEGNHSFFLWGARQTGKTTLLNDYFSKFIRIDLLKSDVFAHYLQNPHMLRTEVAADPGVRCIILDEIQKIPALLDEVHWLIENKKIRFGLTGSSARKLKRGQANLLGGRAIRYELFGLVSKELGEHFNLLQMLNRGYLPALYQSESYAPLLRSYLGDYLKEEIAAEGAVRNLPVFANFLSLASLSDTELINFSTFARDVGISSHTAQEYFEILADTLIGRWLPSYRKKPKRKNIRAPKFYFNDVGVVNSLAKRGPLAWGSELIGKAFENWVHHELVAYNAYSEKHLDLSFWQLESGVEVDFLINTPAEVAIEAKSSAKIHSDHLKGLKAFKEEYPNIKKRFVVCMEPTERLLENGIHILPIDSFVKKLWSGELF